jgi:cell division protein FtsB
MTNEVLTKRERHLRRQVQELQDQKVSDANYSMSMVGAMTQKCRTLEKVIVVLDGRINQLSRRTADLELLVRELRQQVSRFEKLHSELAKDGAMYIEAVKARARSRIMREAGEGVREEDMQ